MADQPRRSFSELLQAALGVVTALTALSAAVAKYFGVVNSFLPAWFQVPQPIQSALPTLVVVAGLFVAWNGLRPRSRLLRPEMLLIAPDRPEHLEGRTDDIEGLKKACRDNRMVCLVGESGAGKTALLRAGLLPKIGDAFLPIYIDGLGDDWERGPRRSLREAFVRSLTEAQRNLLAIGPSLEDDALFGALRRCSPAIGRTPLIVLDQFDDYQNLHRQRFLVNQIWIDTDTLLAQNAFWADLRRALAAEEIRVLVTTRSDASEGLESIRLVSRPLMYHLSRLGKSVVEPLLIRLTEPAKDAPPIVASPESGWVQLRARLASELSNSGTVLGAQMRVVFAGLANLNPLSIGSFEAIGGLHGLEAAYVRGHVTETARISGLSEPRTRRLLLALVDAAGMKTVPKTERDLRTVVAAHPPEVAAGDVDAPLRRALDDLIAKQLVRVRPTGSSEPAYALVHDYLCAGVLEVERQANRWLATLQERHHTFESTTGNALRAWRALLTPALSIRLAFHRLRGQFRYGPYARYAAWSLVRFSPLVAGLAIAVFIGLKAAEFQRELQSQFEEVDVRDRVNRMFDPLGVGSPDDPLSNGETRALWQLATSDYAVRRAFLRKVLESSDNARRFLRRHAVVLHALWGLDRDLARRLCEEACWPEHANDSDPEIIQAQAVIGTALPAPNLVLLESVLSNAPVMIPRLKNPTDLAPVAERVAAFARRSDAGYARGAFDRLFTNLEHQYVDDTQNATFGIILAALADRLAPEDLRSAFQRTQSLVGTPHGLKRWPAFAKALIRLAARLGPAEAQSPFALLLSPDIASVTYLPQSIPIIAGHFADLGLVVAKLSEEDARRDLERLLALAQQARPFSSWSPQFQPAFRPLFGAFGPRLDPATADATFRRCWSGLIGPNYISRSAYGECVQMLASILGPQSAKEFLSLLAPPKSKPSYVVWNDQTSLTLTADLARRLESPDAAALFMQVRMAIRNAPYASVFDTQLLVALARRIDVRDLHRLFEPPVVKAGSAGWSHDALRTVVAELEPLDQKSQNSNVWPAYAVLLERAAAAIDPSDAEAVFSQLSAPFQSKTYYGDMLRPHGLAIAALAPKLGSDSVAPAFEILTRMVGQSFDSDAWQAFGAGLQALGPRLERAKAADARQSLYEAIVAPNLPVIPGYPPSAEAPEVRKGRRAAYGLALSGVVRPGDEPLLLELLKRPDEITQSKEALVSALAKLFGDPSAGNDLWKVVDAAEKKHLDVISPPHRW